MSPVLVSMLMQTVVWPLLVTFAVLAAGHLAGGRGSRPRIARAAPGLALATGFMAAYRLGYGALSLPPADPTGWLLALAPAAWLLSTADAALSPPAMARAAWQAVFAMGAAALVLAPLLSNNPGSVLAVLTLGAGLWLAVWAYLDHWARQQAGGVLLLGVAAGMAVVLSLTGSTLLGQLGGALAAMLGGCLAWNGFAGRAPLGHAGVAVAVTLLGGLLLAGRVYADSPASLCLLLLSAFAVDALGRLLPGRRAWVVRVLAAVPIGVAAALAVSRYLAAPPGY